MTFKEAEKLSRKIINYNKMISFNQMISLTYERTTWNNGKKPDAKYSISYFPCDYFCSVVKSDSWENAIYDLKKDIKRVRKLRTERGW